MLAASTKYSITEIWPPSTACLSRERVSRIRGSSYASRAALVSLISDMNDFAWAWACALARASWLTADADWEIKTPGFTSDEYEVITEKPERIDRLYRRKRAEFDSVEVE